MEFIQSKDNKTIKRIVSLGQRKNRSKCGEYIVEGIRSIRDISTMGVIKTIVIRESKYKDKNIWRNYGRKNNKRYRWVLLC